LANDNRLAKLLMPISGSTSEKHLSTRTAAATEESRELLDEALSCVIGVGLTLLINGVFNVWHVKKSNIENPDENQFFTVIHVEMAIISFSHLKEHRSS
jgi:hypothetical protein